MKKRGCLTWIIGFLIICFMIPFYVLAWIPAIGFIIYYLIKRDFSGKRKRNFIISIIVFVTSLLWFIWAANNTVFPKQKDIKKQPMFTCLQTKEYCY